MLKFVVEGAEIDLQVAFTTNADTNAKLQVEVKKSISPLPFTKLEGKIGGELGAGEQWGHTVGHTLRIRLKPDLPGHGSLRVSSDNDGDKGVESID